jgi:hypothetical protein
VTVPIYQDDEDTAKSQAHLSMVKRIRRSKMDTWADHTEGIRPYRRRLKTKKVPDSTANLHSILYLEPIKIGKTTTTSIETPETPGRTDLERETSRSTSRNETWSRLLARESSSGNDNVNVRRILRTSDLDRLGIEVAAGEHDMPPDFLAYVPDDFDMADFRLSYLYRKKMMKVYKESEPVFSTDSVLNIRKVYMYMDPIMVAIWIARYLYFIYSLMFEYHNNWSLPKEDGHQPTPKTMKDKDFESIMELSVIHLLEFKAHAQSIVLEGIADLLLHNLVGLIFIKFNLQEYPEVVYRQLYINSTVETEYSFIPMLPSVSRLTNMYRFYFPSGEDSSGFNMVPRHIFPYTHGIPVTTFAEGKKIGKYSRSLISVLNKDARVWTILDILVEDSNYFSAPIKEIEEMAKVHADIDIYRFAIQLFPSWHATSIVIFHVEKIIFLIDPHGRESQAPRIMEKSVLNPLMAALPTYSLRLPREHIPLQYIDGGMCGLWSFCIELVLILNRKRAAESSYKRLIGNMARVIDLMMTPLLPAGSTMEDKNREYIFMMSRLLHTLYDEHRRYHGQGPYREDMTMLNKYALENEVEPVIFAPSRKIRINLSPHDAGVS